MRIIFLHIPKTAGHTVHAALEEAFGTDALCPARYNDDLRKMTISELNNFRVFSGHLDWSLLDCIKGPRYVFTVLRKPIDRILSFYFFLRSQASGMSPDDLKLPTFTGAKWALELSPDDYFAGDNPLVRSSLDPFYDNIYSFYFFGRYYMARQDLRTQMAWGSIDSSDIVRGAKDNICSIDDVFTVNNMERLLSTIEDISGMKLSAQRYRVLNANSEVLPENRFSVLQQLGATEKTFSRLADFCAMDDELWRLYE